jgi:hypothetical protein
LVKILSWESIFGILQAQCVYLQVVPVRGDIVTVISSYGRRDAAGTVPSWAIAGDLRGYCQQKAGTEENSEAQTWGGFIQAFLCMDAAAVAYVDCDGKKRRL